jgi:hypothetical protein
LQRELLDYAWLFLVILGGLKSLLFLMETEQRQQEASYVLAFPIQFRVKTLSLKYDFTLASPGPETCSDTGTIVFNP